MAVSLVSCLKGNTHRLLRSLLIRPQAGTIQRRMLLQDVSRALSLCRRFPDGPSTAVYINSLLVTLNARNSIQKTSEYTDTGLLVVPVSHGNHARTANRQSVIQDAKPPKLDLGRAKSSNMVGNHADVITFSFEKTHDRDGGNSEAS